MIYISDKTNLYELARELTTVSELFEDEVIAVEGELNMLLNDANEFGCELTYDINDIWGHTIPVTAIPTTKKHHWVF